MANDSARILEALAKTKGSLCDDCLAQLCAFSQRQQANAGCRKLAAAGQIVRDSFASCTKCRDSKITNRLRPLSTSAAAPAVTRSSSAIDLAHRPWFWEGSVQRSLVAWMIGQGWSIVSHADTAQRKPGKDIVATRENRKLWVSVKGYPVGTHKTNAPTQARHWFSHAVFDVVMYRTEDPSVELAIGLPDVGVTYHRLAERSQWVFRGLPCRIIWVSEFGMVREQYPISS